MQQATLSAKTTGYASIKSPYVTHKLVLIMYIMIMTMEISSTCFVRMDLIICGIIVDAVRMAAKYPISSTIILVRY